MNLIKDFVGFVKPVFAQTKWVVREEITCIGLLYKTEGEVIIFFEDLFITIFSHLESY